MSRVVLIIGIRGSPYVELASVCGGGGGGDPGASSPMYVMPPADYESVAGMFGGSLFNTQRLRRSSGLGVSMMPPAGDYWDIAVRGEAVSGVK
jgi:hypothetical protein